jgi:ATP-dependent DNA helicase RecQ
MSTIVRLDRERHQHFGAVHVIDIVRGNRTARVESFHHDRLSTFGIGEELSDAEWRAVVRQLLARGELEIGPGGHGVLVVTQAGWEVLRGHVQVPLRTDVALGRTKKAKTPRSSGGKQVSIAEPTSDEQALFEKLRAWRASVAAERSVPAYVIFHDSTLREFASQRPQSLTDLAGISGVGKVKLESFGEAVLELVSQTGDD